jgi:hypothetical protein
MKTQNTITALAPTPEPFDSEWSQATLNRIVADAPAPSRRRRTGRLIALAAAGAVVVSAGTAVALGGPEDVVRGLIENFSEQPNTTGNGLGKLEDPLLVAQFETPTHQIFAFWVATSSSGKVCYASSDGTWDGKGLPTKAELEYGCGGEIWTGGNSTTWLSRTDQIGGFFKDTDGPILYGVSPYPTTASVRVQGAGIDRTLPVLSDSHGYGAGIPEAVHALSVRLTFLDASGHVLGSKKVVAPIG